MKKEVFDKFVGLATSLLVSLSLIVFFPFLADSFGLGKQIYLFGAGLFIFVLWTVKVIKEKKISFYKSRFLGLALAFLIISLLSAFLAGTPNKIVSLLSLTGGGSLLLVILVYLYLQNLTSSKMTGYFLLGAGAIMSLLTIILNIGILKLPLNFPSLGFSLGETFSLTGSLLMQTVILAALLPVGFALSYENLGEKKNFPAAVIFGLNILLLAGIGIGISLLSTSARPSFLPQATAWSIAVEGLKNFKSALLGAGPGQFFNAFTSFRPLSYNSSALWNVRFISSSWYLQILTELGFLGLFVYLAIFWKIIKKAIVIIRQQNVQFFNLALALSLIILLITQFFLPISLVVLLMFFILLALFEKTEEAGYREVDLSPLGSAGLVFLIFPLLLWGFLSYFAVRLGLGASYFASSIQAAANNDGARTYNLQIKAIQANPWFPAYRTAYAQTNFALASSLASQQNLSENDRNTVTQLVQQSLREAKAAIALDPKNVTNWENLAGLYRNLINFAQGAEDWAIASYQEAIKLDPLNPQLRLDLGGVYFSKKDYRQSIPLFNQAVGLKPDFANAHYNLANALVQFGALAEAKDEYEAALSLVKIDSNDYQKVSAELEELKKKLPSPTPAQKPGEPETLSTPKIPTPVIKPPLSLPDEGPPVTENQPEEEASPTTQPQS